MPGAICTILLFFVVFIFAGYKFNVLVQKTEYDVIKESFEYHFDQTHKFGNDDGFAVAATITEFDSGDKSIENERIGTIKFYLKHWVGAEKI